jgi:hypothetical protein
MKFKLVLCKAELTAEKQMPIIDLFVFPGFAFAKSQNGLPIIISLYLCFTTRTILSNILACLFPPTYPRIGIEQAYVVRNL